MRPLIPLLLDLLGAGLFLAAVVVFVGLAVRA
jgi:hypothetical protein